MSRPQRQRKLVERYGVSEAQSDSEDTPSDSSHSEIDDQEVNDEIVDEPVGKESVHRVAKSKNPSRARKTKIPVYNAAESSLFEAVVAKQDTKGHVKSILQRWMNGGEYQLSSKREILNFLFSSSGAVEPILTDEDAVDDLSSDDLMVLGRRVSTEVLNIVTEESYFILGATAPKGYRDFLSGFSSVWDELISEGTDDVLYDMGLLEVVTDILITLSTHGFRPLRHVCVSASLSLMLALHRRAMQTQLEISMLEQTVAADAETLLHIENKTSSTYRLAVSKHSASESSLLAAQRSLAESSASATALLQGVFQLRYRDSAPAIRNTVLSTLEVMLTEFPSQFLSNSFLKYAGWLLNDRVPSVRLRAVQLLLAVLQLPSEKLVETSEFFMRFRPRFLELCRDVEPLVAAAALSLVQKAVSEGLMPPVEVTSLRTGILSADQAIRAAAGSMLLSELSAFQSIDVAHAEKSERMADAKIAQGTALQRQQRDQIDALVSVALELQTLLTKEHDEFGEFLEQNSTTEIRGVGSDSSVAMEFLVSSLWPFVGSRCQVLLNADAIAGYVSRPFNIITESGQAELVDLPLERKRMSYRMLHAVGMRMCGEGLLDGPVGVPASLFTPQAKGGSPSSSSSLSNVLHSVGNGANELGEDESLSPLYGEGLTTDKEQSRQALATYSSLLLTHAYELMRAAAGADDSCIHWACAALLLADQHSLSLPALQSQLKQLLPLLSRAVLQADLAAASSGSKAQGEAAVSSAAGLLAFLASSASGGSGSGGAGGRSTDALGSAAAAALRAAATTSAASAVRLIKLQVDESTEIQLLSDESTVIPKSGSKKVSGTTANEVPTTAEEQSYNLLDGASSTANITSVTIGALKRCRLLLAAVPEACLPSVSALIGPGTHLGFAVRALLRSRRSVASLFDFASTESVELVPQASEALTTLAPELLAEALQLLLTQAAASVERAAAAASRLNVLSGAADRDAVAELVAEAVHARNVAAVHAVLSLQLRHPRMIPEDEQDRAQEFGGEGDPSVVDSLFGTESNPFLLPDSASVETTVNTPFWREKMLEKRFGEFCLQSVSQPQTLATYIITPATVAQLELPPVEVAVVLRARIAGLQALSSLAGLCPASLQGSVMEHLSLWVPDGVAATTAALVNGGLAYPPEQLWMLGVSLPFDLSVEASETLPLNLPSDVRETLYLDQEDADVASLTELIQAGSISLSSSTSTGDVSDAELRVLLQKARTQARTVKTTARTRASQHAKVQLLLNPLSTLSSACPYLDRLGHTLLRRAVPDVSETGDAGSTLARTHAQVIKAVPGGPAFLLSMLLRSITDGATGLQRLRLRIASTASADASPASVLKHIDPDMALEVAAVSSEVVELIRTQVGLFAVGKAPKSARLPVINHLLFGILAAIGEPSNSSNSGNNPINCLEKPQILALLSLYVGLLAPEAVQVVKQRWNVLLTEALESSPNTKKNGRPLLDEALKFVKSVQQEQKASKQKKSSTNNENKAFIDVAFDGNESVREWLPAALFEFALTSPAGSQSSLPLIVNKVLHSWMRVDACELNQIASGTKSKRSIGNTNRSKPSPNKQSNSRTKHGQDDSDDATEDENDSNMDEDTESEDDNYKASKPSPRTNRLKSIKNNASKVSSKKQADSDDSDDSESQRKVSQSRGRTSSKSSQSMVRGGSHNPRPRKSISKNPNVDEDTDNSSSRGSQQYSVGSSSSSASVLAMTHSNLLSQPSARVIDGDDMDY